MNDNGWEYQEVDFLLPAQKFNIQFSYVSQKGLSFVREFVLRLVHSAPMNKTHIANFFGLSRLEAEEAVSDLVQRGELTLLEDGRLKLTEKANGYFTDIGETPRLSTVQDSGASLTFELASFNCIGNGSIKDQWRFGLPLRVDSNNSSQSERLAEKHFQLQFDKILDKGLLPNSLSSNDKERPHIYTVNSVNKLRQLPLRLKTHFKVDVDGKAMEREDFDELNNSEGVHALMAMEISKLSKPNNIVSITKSMIDLADETSLKAFDTKTNALNPLLMEELWESEWHNENNRITFLGPVYTKRNWEEFQKMLAAILAPRVRSKKDTSSSRFVWIAPSDPFWGKSDSFTTSLGDFINKSSVKGKILYKPTLYVPLSGIDDHRAAKQFKNELEGYHEFVNGLAEGFFDGNVEVLYLEGELISVVYHLSQPENLPVSMPLGFVSNSPDVVRRVGGMVMDYINGISSFDNPNDLGTIASKAARRKGFSSTIAQG